MLKTQLPRAHREAMWMNAVNADPELKKTSKDITRT
jgi:hypothetical protein